MSAIIVKRLEPRKRVSVRHTERAHALDVSGEVRVVARKAELGDPGDRDERGGDRDVAEARSAAIERAVADRVAHLRERGAELGEIAGLAMGALEERLDDALGELGERTRLIPAPRVRGKNDGSGRARSRRKAIGRKPATGTPAISRSGGPTSSTSRASGATSTRRATRPFRARAHRAARDAGVCGARRRTRSSMRRNFRDGLSPSLCLSIRIGYNRRAMSRVPFHPLVERWFEHLRRADRRAGTGWPAIAARRRHADRRADRLGQDARGVPLGAESASSSAGGGEPRGPRAVVYVSPLKALGNDIQRNLPRRSAGSAELAEREGLRSRRRSASPCAPATRRRRAQRQLRRPPHILITTPESLYILLTAEKSRAVPRRRRDGHRRRDPRRRRRQARRAPGAVARAARRARRAAACSASACRRRSGRSRRSRRLLVGAGGATRTATPRCAIVDVGHRRDARPARSRSPDTSSARSRRHELWAEIYDRIVALVAGAPHDDRLRRTRAGWSSASRTRSSERLGEGRVAAHHGSMARAHRGSTAEERLKAGEVPVVVATASLELGIDVGARRPRLPHRRAARARDAAPARRPLRPRARRGAEGHPLPAHARRAGAVRRRRARGRRGRARRARRAARTRSTSWRSRCVAHRRDAARSASRRSVALVRRAYPYRAPAARATSSRCSTCWPRASRRGAAGARRISTATACTARCARGAARGWPRSPSGGAIPDTADYDVVEEPTGALVGTVNEDFAVESMAGDIFLLGNQLVADPPRRGRAACASRTPHGAPPTIPFWLGEAPARTRELSRAVGRAAREEVAARRRARGASSWLDARVRRSTRDGAEQLVALRRRRRGRARRRADARPPSSPSASSTRPAACSSCCTRRSAAASTAPGASRCASASASRFDFELQAAATDDGIVISLGEQHSFPLDERLRLRAPGHVRARTSRRRRSRRRCSRTAGAGTRRARWRCCAISGGKQGADAAPAHARRGPAGRGLPGAGSPAATTGRRADRAPGPSARERDDRQLPARGDGRRRARAPCWTGIERGDIRTVAVETPAPSPMSHEILNANPYAYLDDAPLEERRARAVSLRRVDPGPRRRPRRARSRRDRRGRADRRGPTRATPTSCTTCCSRSACCRATRDRRTGWTGFAERCSQRAARRRRRLGEHSALVAAERVGLVRARAPGRSPSSPPVPDAARSSRRVERGRGARSLEIVARLARRRRPDDRGRARGSASALPDCARRDRARAARAQGARLRGRFTAGATGDGASGASAACSRASTA